MNISYVGIYGSKRGEKFKTMWLIYLETYSKISYRYSVLVSATSHLVVVGIYNLIPFALSNHLSW